MIGVLNVLQSNELSLDSNFVPVLDSADIERLEVLKGVLIANPESPVVLLLSVSKADLLTELWSPLRGLVAPISFPFIMLE